MGHFGRARSFAAQVLTVMTGSVLAQAIPLIAAPLLARLYGPSEFGYYGGFMAVVGIAGPCSTATYEQAIMLPREQAAGRHLLSLTLVLAGVLSVLVLLAAIVGGGLLARTLGLPGLGPYLYWAPLYVASYGAFQALYFWAHRQQRFEATASSRVVQAAVAVAISLALGVGGVQGGLIVGAVLAQVIATAYLALQRGLISRTDIVLHAAELGAVAFRYRDLPRYSLPQQFLDGLRESALAATLTGAFGPGALGLYMMANRLLKAPLAVIGSALSQVYYQKAAHLSHSGERIWPSTWKLLKRVLLAAVVIFPLLIVMAPLVFGVALGSKWEEAGHLSRYLAPWLLVNFVSAPLSMIPTILGRQRQFLWIGIGYNTLVPLVAVTASRWGQTVRGTVGWVSVAAGLYLVGVIAWIVRVVRERDSNAV
jgi:O-antigen/teichoic acid export membrane protein